MNLLKLAFLPVFIYVLMSVLEIVKDKYLPALYIFDPVELQEIVSVTLKENEGANNTVIVSSLGKHLSARYGDYIKDINFDDWCFSNAGGAMGTFFILHASLTEYLIVFGTATGTEGHTGHHLADDYFIILSEQQSAAYSGQLDATIYKPGSMHHLPYLHCQQYAMPPGGYALELAQGYIPTMLLFGFADSVFSTIDPFNLWGQVKFTLISIVKNLLLGKI